MGNRPEGMATVSVEDVSGERLRLKVTDAALGISPEKMARLFTPFDRLGAEENGVDGTGLQGGPGLELAKEHRPGLILLHLRLPDISGVEVLRRLQQDPRARRIPVVVLNADATSGQVNRLLADGAREFLTKPLDVKQLLRSSTSSSSMRP